MSNTLLKTAFAAFALSSTLLATEASAKIKEVKFHFVKGAYEDYPTYEMKYQGGSWKWVNKGKTFKPRMKFLIKHNNNSVLHSTNAKFMLEGVKFGNITNVLKKHEELATLTIGKNYLHKKEAAARGACNSYGGSKKVVKDMGLIAKLTVTYTNGGKLKQKVVRDAVMTAKVVCHGKGPTRNPQSADNSSGHSTLALKLKTVKLYSIPAKPRCGKPVKMVAEFHTNRPGKVNFLYHRSDGKKQNASVTTSKSGSGFTKRWAKTYTFNKTTSRKYAVLVKDHNKSTQWVPLKVTCIKGPGTISG